MGGMDWEFGISRCKVLYIEWINNKVLLYSRGNYIHYPVMNHNGKEYEKEYICIYMYVCVYIQKTESLCCTPEMNTTLQINYTSTKNINKLKKINSVTCASEANEWAGWAGRLCAQAAGFSGDQG